MPRQLPSDFRRFTDKALRAWIVEERAGWPEAYDTLFHRRYGGVIKDAMNWVEGKYNITLDWGTVVSKLFLNMFGERGNWTGLKSWARERGTFRRWLWVVVRNVCYRILREEHRLGHVERVSPTGAMMEDEPGRTVPDSDVSIEDILTLDMLLRQLGEECERLLRLKYYHGLTDTEIGQRQGVGREWVNRKLRRCKNQLADLMHGEGLAPSDFAFREALKYGKEAMTERNDFDTNELETLLQQAGQAWRTRILPALEEARRKLPEQDATLLQLSIYQQASDDEIARLLEIPGGAEVVPALRIAAVAKLAGGGWAHDLTREKVEALLEMAGETWRRAVAEPLSEAEQAAAKQAMTRVVQAVEPVTPLPVPGPSRQAAPPKDRRLRLRLLLERLQRLWPQPAFQRVGVVFIVLLALYGTLWLAGRAVRPETYALASIRAYEETLSESARGASNTHRDFAQGAEALLAAPKSTLGLFPRYDPAQVERADVHLSRAFEATTEPFQRARIAFFLAKAALMQADTTGARDWLNQVLNQNVSLYREDAEVLLRALDTL